MIASIVTRCAIGAALLFTWSSSAWPARVLRAPGGGAVRAVLIGINKYPNLDKASELNGAVADAEDLTGTLAKVGVPAANVRTLKNGDAVRDKVVAEMDRLVSESKSGDLAIIAYSGHGMRVGAYKRWDGLDRSGVHSQNVMANFSPADPKNGHEVIVDREMRAWYARLDAKGVDVLVVMDSCHGGGMRAVVPFSGEIKVRAYTAPMNDKVHDSFEPIKMNEKEARVDPNELRHVTFFAGATDESTVPEMSGIDRANPTAARGALSYFVARALGGEAQSGKITRAQLFKYLSPNVREKTQGRQFIDFGPRTENDDAVLQQVVFRIDDTDAPPPVDNQDPKTPPTPLPPEEVKVVPVRVAIVNGSKDLFSSIDKGRVPFVSSEPSEADLVWDVRSRTALSRGDLVMSKVDGSLLGAVIDRTWAVREIQKLATGRIIDVQMGDHGKAYTLGDAPTLVADGIGGSYLAVVNVAADGTIQLLYPFYPSNDPHMTTDKWTRAFNVDLPLGTDYTVVIATSAPASDLVGWLRAHNQKHDAFDLPAVLASKIKADKKTRLGTAGLFTQ